MYCSLAFTETYQFEEMSVILVIKSPFIKKKYHHTSLSIKKKAGGQTEASLCGKFEKLFSQSKYFSYQLSPL
jgi:hypothetical protein